MTIGDFLSQNTGGGQVMTLDDFNNGTSTPHQDYTPLPEEGKPGFLKGIALNLYAGFENGSANFQDFIGLDNIPYFRKGIENSRKTARDIFNITKSDNFWVDNANKLTKSLGSLGSTLPIDVVTGNVTKVALAGKVLPAVEAAVSKLPDFALGSGWRGMIEGIQASQAQGDNPLVSDIKGIAKGAADTALNASFAAAGTGLKGITTMAALGGGMAATEAASRGQYPSKEELASGMAQGAAYGVIFTILPHLASGSRLGPEKLALESYDGEISKHIEDGNFEGVKTAVDTLVKDETIRPEIRDTVSQTITDMAKETGIETPQVKEMLNAQSPGEQTQAGSQKQKLVKGEESGVHLRNPKENGLEAQAGNEITPLPGTGETKTRTLSAGVEAKAIAEKLTKGFGDLPEYRTLNLQDQAQKATDLMSANPEQARRIAMGDEAPPQGITPESVFVAVEDKAIKEGDVNTLRDLATASRLSVEATTMGQRIRTLGERDPESPVGAIKEIQNVREKKAGKVDTKSVVKEIKQSIKKNIPTKETWESFISSLEC